MLLLIDNYDSFVYNLARYVKELGFDYIVKRNDEISIEEIKSLSPSHIILSPGPCAPNQAGITLDVIANFYKTIPILGVCLGHQAIGQFFGAKVTKAKNPMHGKSSFVSHNKKDIFAKLKSPLRVARYHSLIVNDESDNLDFEVIAKCEDGEIMALRHKNYPTFGVQFHPESVLTEFGHQLLESFLFIDV